MALDRCGGTRSAPLVPALWHRMGKAPLHGVKAPPLHPHLSQCLLAATHRVGKRPGRRMVTWDRYVRPLQRARVCVRVVRLPCKVASTRIAVFARAKSATHTTDLIKSPARAAPPLWLLGVCHRRTPLSMSLAHRVFMFCSARPTKIRLICHRNRTYRVRRNWFCHCTPHSFSLPDQPGNHVGAECSRQLAHALVVHHPVQQATCVAWGCISRLLAPRASLIVML